MKFNLHSFIFFCLCIAFSYQAFAQSDSLEITRISRNDSTNLLDIYVSAPPGPDVQINANTIRFLEQVPGKGMRECRLDILGFTDAKPEGFIQESVTILFLLDYSGSMKKDDRLGKSKATIKEVISQISLPAGSKFELAAFHDDVFESVPINKYNIDKELAKYPTPEGGGKDTDLFRAMIEKIDELSLNNGKKILVLLSDGRNDNLRNQYYSINNKERPTADDVYKKIRFVDLTNELMVLTYGIGNGIDSTFLKELPSITEAVEDKHYFITDPRSISKILVDQLSEYNNDYRFKVRPTCNEYRGELRNLMVEWRSSERGNQYDQREYKLGASIEPEYVGVSNSGKLNWFLLLMIGLVIVFGALFLFIYLIPKINRRKFIKKHVVKYVPEPSKIKRDPITQDIIQEGDRVVVKCNQMTTLDTWDALGYCPNFPSCMEFQDACTGKGGEETNNDFFSQKGVTKIYNWLWYGSLGGLIGWIIYSGLFRLTEMKGLNNYVRSFFDDSNLDPNAAFNEITSFAQNTNSFVEQTFQGAILGTALIAAITVVEELGSTRKFSPLRVGLRVFIGIIVSFLVFGGGFALQYIVLNGDVLFSGLINWAVFGILFGIILSIYSTIELKNGVLGGLISCIVAYGVYYGILELVPNDELAKLLSFVLLGGILGALIVKVIASLENFELVYLSPQEYNGMVKPISKWLKNGMEVFIGRSAKCYVFVKWNDEYVEDKHAMLVLENGRVHIIALYETLLNGVIIPENQKVELNNDDIIQLGRYSNSKMQYKQR
jgi:hypothetical protein